MINPSVYRIDFPANLPASPKDLLLIWQGRELVSEGSTLLHRRDTLPASLGLGIPVAVIDGQAYFTLITNQKEQNTTTLRALVADERLLILAARARTLLDFYDQHRFCGQCGQAVSRMQQEVAMECFSCQRHYYPPISPCVIVLIIDGPRVLLAQGHRHKNKGWYSTLAGFIETGESAEQAVHREIHEEVGVSLGALHYQGSQTWPFPHQLMLGFWAEYQGGDIVLQPDEILDAQWFDVRALPELPPAESIATQMVHRYQQYYLKQC